MIGKHSYLIFCILLLNILQGSGQNITRFQTNQKEYLVGQPIQLDLTISNDNRSSVWNLEYAHLRSTPNKLFAKDTLQFESVADIELLSSSEWKDFSLDKTNVLNIKNQPGTKDFSNRFVLAVYNPGIYTIYPPTVNGILDTSKQVSINIIVPATDSLPDLMGEEIYPVKDIFLERPRWTDYLYILYILIGLGILYFLWKRSKRKKVEQKDITDSLPAISPAKRALEKLIELEKTLIDNQMSLEDFHDKNAYIIREYISGELHVPSLEMSTSETIERLSSHVSVNYQNRERINRLLNISDLVKFAKSESKEELIDILLADSRQFIHETADKS